MLQLHWLKKAVNLERSPAYFPRHGTANCLWSKEGGDEQIMPCGAQDVHSHWITGAQSNAHFWRIPPLIGSIHHPRFSVNAFTVFLFFAPSYVSSVNFFIRRRSDFCDPLQKLRTYCAQRQRLLARNLWGRNKKKTFGFVALCTIRPLFFEWPAAPEPRYRRRNLTTTRPYLALA